MREECAHARVSTSSSEEGESRCITCTKLCCGKLENHGREKGQGSLRVAPEGGSSSTTALSATNCIVHRLPSRQGPSVEENLVWHDEDSEEPPLKAE